jgi:hypothetical protein
MKPVSLRSRANTQPPSGKEQTNPVSPRLTLSQSFPEEGVSLCRLALVNGRPVMLPIPADPLAFLTTGFRGIKVSVYQLDCSDYKHSGDCPSFCEKNLRHIGVNLLNDSDWGEC